MQIICTSLQTDNRASTSSLNFLQAGCSSWHPTSSVKALKVIKCFVQTAFTGAPQSCLLMASHTAEAVMQY